MYLVCFAVIGSLLFTACKTKSPEKELVSDQVGREEPKKPEETAQVEEKLGNQTEKEVKTPEEPEAIEEPKEEEKIEEEVTKEPEAPEEPEEDFVVTDEVFAQTFSDVEALITELNKTIRNQNYEKWLTFLTEEYKNYYSNQEVLRELSKKPTMQKYDIRLTTLKDYFTYVVVPSRSNARLDDLVFEDNNHVKAIMIIDEQRVILYQLVKVDGEWKIGV